MVYSVFARVVVVVGGGVGGWGGGAEHHPLDLGPSDPGTLGRGGGEHLIGQTSGEERGEGAQLITLNHRYVMI